MAGRGRNNDSHTNGQNKGTFRFRYMDSNRQFEVTADDVSGDKVLEGFRYVANTLAGRNSAALAPKLLNQAANPAGASAEVSEENPQDVLPFQDTPAPPASTGEEPEVVEANLKPRVVRSPKAPKFLKDLDLSKASVRLEDFMDQKKPETDVEKYAVIAVWMKDQFGIEEISIDHIFTAYTELNWIAQMPPDPGQTFRNMKAQKNWCDAGSGKGLYKVNWKGTDAVNKMGTAKAAAKGA